MINRLQIAFASLFLFGLLTGCGKNLVVTTDADENVVVTGPADMFVEAFSKANAICQQDAKNAQYVSDYAEELDVVAFECIDLAAAEAAVDSEVPEEEAPEESISAEELPAETETEEIQAE